MERERLGNITACKTKQDAGCMAAATRHVSKSGVPSWVVLKAALEEMGEGQ